MQYWIVVVLHRRNVETQAVKNRQRPLEDNQPPGDRLTWTCTIQREGLDPEVPKDARGLWMTAWRPVPPMSRRSGRARPHAANGAARNNTIMIILEIQLFHGIMSYWSVEINRFPNIPK